MAKLALLDFQDLDIPAAWLPLLKNLIRWYNNQAYPVMSIKNQRDTPKQRANNLAYSFLPTVRDMWAIQDDAEKAAWGVASDFIDRSGYQLFVKDLCLRIKSGYPGMRIPSAFFSMFGLKMANPGGSGNIRLKRGDIALVGQVTVAFNYKKVENAPTGDQPFKFEAILTYLEAGENKTETHTWEAPAGNVAWAAVSETFGTVGRNYISIEVTWHLDSYDAEVWFANFLIEDQSLEWTVNYTATQLPENATPAWAKTGDIDNIEVKGGRLLMEEDAAAATSVDWIRTPSFVNTRGSSVKVNIKVPLGSSKDEGPTKYSFYYTHSDGTYEVKVYFYRNGFKLCFGDEEYSKHQDMSEFKTIRTSIKDNKVVLYMGNEIIFRKTLSGSGGQEVSFGAQAPDDHDLEVWLGYLKYYQGSEAVPKMDILREGFWVKAGKVWVPELATRIEGWTFTPQYIAPYFTVLYLG